MNDTRIYSALAFAGALPFVACALLPLVGIDTIPPFGRLDRLAGSYGMAIISFLAGIHWATQLYLKPRVPINLFVASNVVFLAVWFSYVAASLNWALATQIVAFPVILGIDFELRRLGLISPQYTRTRLVATTMACASLLVIVMTP